MLNKFLAAGLGLAVTLGVAGSAFADEYNTMMTTTSTTTTNSTNITMPDYRGNVNVDIIDSNAPKYLDRISRDLLERPAPQVGQTRAAIDAIYGPAKAAYAPNKPYEIYTNEYDLIDGKMFKRSLTPDEVRVYEITFSNSSLIESPNDKATDVKLRVIPRLGDHKNLVSKLLGSPINQSHKGQNLLYGIPKDRFAFYNDVLSSPYTAVNTYYNAEGFMVGQEFLPARYQGQYALTSAGRYIEVESTHQPDTKVAW